MYIRKLDLCTSLVFENFNTESNKRSLILERSVDG